MKLEDFLFPVQSELFSILREMYNAQSKVISCKDNFILVTGNAPVMLIAHLDTVHQESVKSICTSVDGNILMSPEGIGGDDRAGVYALFKVYELSKVKPFLLFTCDEEIGGIGADNFCLHHQMRSLPPELDELKLLIEIDRKGSNDAVYYDCDNPDLENYITSKGFKTAHGSFSDISYIAPELMIGAVNLSSGYYNPHTLHEYINRTELETTIQKVVEIVEESARDNFPKFEYIEKTILNRFSNFSIGDKKIPADLPAEYRAIYRELLFDFDAEELELYREIHGNKSLYALYKEMCEGYDDLYADSDFD